MMIFFEKCDSPRDKSIQNSLPLGNTESKTMKSRTRTLRLLAVLAATLFCCCAFSQTREDLAGTWRHTEVEEDDGDVCTLDEYMVFNLDGTCVDRGEANLEMTFDDVKFHASFSYSANGTWRLDSDVITYSFDPRSITIVNAEENNMPGILKALLVNPMKNEIKKEIKKHAPSRILSFSAESMVLKDIEGKDATEDLYTRQ